MLGIALKVCVGGWVVVGRWVGGWVVLKVNLVIALAELSLGQAEQKYAHKMFNLDISLYNTDYYIMSLGLINIILILLQYS